jgi:hypothetical protein
VVNIPKACFSVQNLVSQRPRTPGHTAQDLAGEQHLNARGSKLNRDKAAQGNQSSDKNLLVSKAFGEDCIQRDTKDVADSVGHAEGYLPLSVELKIARIIRNFMAESLLECRESKK